MSYIGTKPADAALTASDITDGIITNAKLTSSLQVGKQTIFVPASAMYASTTNGASAEQIETTALRPDIKVMDFADTADDFAQFSVSMPKSWNLGTVTYQVFWTASTTNTGNCIFGLQGVACGDSDTIDVVYGTAITVTETYFQLYRDANAGGDTFTGVARVLGIKIFYTTDAFNDA